MTTNLTLLSQGAESKIYTIQNLIIKYRLPKLYRPKELDITLTKKRTKNEKKIIEKLSQANVKCPKVVSVTKLDTDVVRFISSLNDDYKNDLHKEDYLNEANQNNSNDLKNNADCKRDSNNNEADKKNTEADKKKEKNETNESLNNITIIMERIEGITLKDYIKLNNPKPIFKKLGELINKIHSLNIIHGDITTSNFIVVDDELFVIDFGLSFVSLKDEDKAVDLYVFERALLCTHDEEYLNCFYAGYLNDDVKKRLEKVRLRGRKREENAIG